MSKGFAWLLGLMVVVLIALLVACGSTYNPASDGLVLITSQGSALVQTFSFDLATGSIAEVSNTVNDTSNETCILPGIPSSMVLNPAGTYAFVIINSSDTCPGSQTGIETLAVNSDGTIANSGTVTPDPNPIALAMDLSGNYMFVAEGGVPNVYSIGSGGALTLVPGNFNFVLANGFRQPNMAAIWPTPSAFVVQNAVCSNSGAPAAQYLYVADSQNNVVWEFGVNMSTGALQNPSPNTTQVTYYPTQSVPSGVAVDPCDRFVYVSNMVSNQVNAYTICNGTTTQSSSCPTTPDGRLIAVSGSPFSLAGNANGPGPLVVDALGNYLYVLNTLSNTISPFHISPVSGSISSMTVVGVGNQPKSIAIRRDDSWLFVTNFNSSPPNLSQFAISPQSGTLTPVPTISTDNYPYGVAVK